MATASGYIGTAGASTNLANPVSLHATMGTEIYPTGTISFNDITSGGACWVNSSNQSRSITVYLCDSEGNNAVSLFTVSLARNETSVNKNSATVSGATGLKGKALYLKATGDTSQITLKNRTTVDIGTATQTYLISITSISANIGTVHASAPRAAAGTTVTLTASAGTGYQLSGYTTDPSVTITNSKFTMPASGITITPIFTKISYTITKNVEPSGAGTLTVKRNGTSVSSANYNDSLTLENTANSGYVFNHYEASGGTLSGSTLTMPAKNVTVLAKFDTLSTATIDSTTLKGGESRIVTITPAKSSYMHKVQLRWDAKSLTTSEVTVYPGSVTASITVPTSWANQIPNAVSSTGPTIRVTTYAGTTPIGYTTITGLTYYVPDAAKPSLGTITKALVKPSDPTKYNSVSTTLYIQGYAKVRIQVSASGSYGSTISSIAISVNGYSGSDYNKTVNSSTADVTTGLLTISGTNTITVTATDSRGRTAFGTATVSVSAYSKPSGSLTVTRTNSSRVADDMGEYGTYSLTKSYTSIGNNALTVTISDGTNSGTTTATSGDLLPGNRKTYSYLKNFTITLTLADKLETTTITKTLQSARFILHTNKVTSGNNVYYRMGLMKAAERSIPSGKTSTVEFSSDSQIYIGTTTLENFIAAIALDNCIAKTGGTMTGNLYLNSANLIMKGSAVMRYEGSVATYTMIEFVDNTLNNYGNGIIIGGGGIVIVGAGESCGVLKAGRAAHEENLYLGADGSVFVFTNTNSGLTDAKQFTFGSTGTLTAPAFSGPLTGNVTGNLTGNADTATYATSAGSAGSVTWANVSNKPTFSGSDSALSWGTSTKIATVAGNDVKVMMPVNPNTWRGYQIKSYSYTISSVAANGRVEVTGTNLSVSTPSGYTPVALTKINFSGTGSSYMAITTFNAQATGATTMVDARNVSSEARTNMSISVDVLYLQI